jgi:hypothetical protein
MVTIVFRAVIEVLGTPKEHVEKAIHDYIGKLKEDKEFKVVKADFADVQKQEKQELWSTFADLEIETSKVTNLLNFCFDYMPSSLEVLEPDNLAYENIELSSVLNDLMVKLHGVDMVAKQAKLESDHVRNDLFALLKRFIFVLLQNNNLTATSLSRMTGVKQDRLEDFLDTLIDEGWVDLKEGIYFLKKEEKIKD